MGPLHDEPGNSALQDIVWFTARLYPRVTSDNQDRAFWHLQNSYREIKALLACEHKSVACVHFKSYKKSGARPVEKRFSPSRTLSPNTWSNRHLVNLVVVLHTCVDCVRFVHSGWVPITEGTQRAASGMAFRSRLVSISATTIRQHSSPRAPGRLLNTSPSISPHTETTATIIHPKSGRNV